MSENIDYHALALAQIEVHDTEADRIAAAIPEDLKTHPSKLYVVPPRGSMAGPERLAKAQQIQTRVQAEVARVAQNQAAHEAKLETELKNRVEHEARRALGIPPFGVESALPSDWREWLRDLENGTRTGADFQRFRAQEQAKAKAARAGARGGFL